MRKEYDFSRAKRGPAVRVPKGKSRITIRLDHDVKRTDEPLEATLRRVLREELRSAG